MFKVIDISVIVPVYNADKYLTRCLDSLMSQTYQNIEIILVNDGSTDTSKDIIEEYKHKDNRIVSVHKPNGGESSARNMGLDTAKGTYIAFVDSDDCIHPDMYTSLIGVMNGNNADLAFCDIMWQTQNGSEHIGLSEFTAGVFHKDEISEKLLINITHNRLLRATWNKLYKREIITGNNIRFPEDIVYGPDFIFNIEYLWYANTIYYLNKPLYYYDNTTAGTSKTSHNNILLSGKIINDKLLVLAERKGINSRYFKTKAIGEYIFFARVQLRMNLNNCAHLSVTEQYDKLKEIVYDKDFRDNITRNKYILFLVFLNKNFTCKLIILAVMFRLPGLLLPKIWLNYMTKNALVRKHSDRQNQRA